MTITTKIKQIARESLFEFLEGRGYVVQTHTRPEMESFRAFRERARNIETRHKAQTLETVTVLRKKYARALLGKASIWDIITQLAFCIDPQEVRLGCTSQLTHVLQVLDAMDRDGVDDPDMLVAALIHDIGKVMLLYGEAPEHVESGGHKAPLGDPEPGVGLDNCDFQWDHCDIAYSRLKDYVPDHIAWLLRYHGISVSACEPFMDVRDRKYLKEYLRIFARYDDDAKSLYSLPQFSIDRYRELIQERFPKEILF